MNDFFKEKNILITGGSGFVGRNLIGRLLEAGAQISVVDTRIGIRDLPSPDLTFFPIDITDYHALQPVIQKIRPHFIFHLAAIVTASRDWTLIDPMIETNLKGTTNIIRSLDGLDGLECMINFGTCEEYGNQDTRLDESLREEPASPYAIVKLAATKFCRMFSQAVQVPITTVRPANLYGPGQPRDKLIPYTILKCLKNESMDMTHGEQKRNFVFIDDFIDAVLLIAQKERRLAQIYNIGSETGVSLRSVVELIRKMLNSDSIINFGAITYRENEMMISDFNIDKVKSLGWKPEFNLEDGLRQTIESYKWEMTGG